MFGFDCKFCLGAAWRSRLFEQ